MLRSRRPGLLRGDARPLPALCEAAALATGTTVEVTFSRRGHDDAQQPGPGRALPGQHGRLRHRGPGRRRERRQHGHGQRQLGLPDDPPRPRDRAEGTPGHSILFRDAAVTPAGRRGDAARRDARRPDRVRAVRGPGARRRGVGASSARPDAAPGRAWAYHRRGAPRWTTDSNRRRPQRDGSDPRRSPPRPSPEDHVAERPHDPDPASGFASRNGWDRDVRDVSRLRPADLRRAGDVHEAALDHGPGRAPPARASTSRSSARRSTTPSATAGRPLRAARDPRGAVHVGSIHSLQLGVEPFEVLDRRRRRRREHRPGLDRARPTR